MISGGGNHHLEPEYCYTELEGSNGNYWILGHINSVLGEGLCFSSGVQEDPDELREALEEVGYGDNVAFVGPEVLTH